MEGERRQGKQKKVVGRHQEMDRPDFAKSQRGVEKRDK